MSGSGDHIEQHIGGDVIGSEIIGKKVVIHAAPEPQVRPRLEVENQKQDDGTYLTRAVVDIDAHYAQTNPLLFEARGTTIKEFSLFNSPPFMSRGLTVKGGGMRKQLDFPKGGSYVLGPPLDHRYEVDVRTEKEEKVEIDVLPVG